MKDCIKLDILNEFNAGSFDVIICCRSLHFLSDIPQALNSFKQLLKKPGTDSFEVNIIKEKGLKRYEIQTKYIFVLFVCFQLILWL